MSLRGGSVTLASSSKGCEGAWLYFAYSAKIHMGARRRMEQQAQRMAAATGGGDPSAGLRGEWHQLV